MTSARRDRRVGDGWEEPGRVRALGIVYLS